ncbi:MAG TPA: hypothetical protein VNO19_08125 [Gemmatimonadales bacterium]|nr:hypothetical protein [Gemmatimonadales bacterium]
MRVVFLTHNYPLRPGDPSGAALGTLARALMRRGIAVRVVTPSDESGPVVVDGVPVSRVRAGRSIREIIAGMREETREIARDLARLEKLDVRD